MFALKLATKPICIHFDGFLCGSQNCINTNIPQLHVIHYGQNLS